MPIYRSDVHEPLPGVKEWADTLDLTRRGREWIGPCPLCGGDDRFHVRDSGGRATVGCRGCIDGQSDGERAKRFGELLRAVFPARAFTPERFPTMVPRTPPAHEPRVTAADERSVWRVGRLRGWAVVGEAAAVKGRLVPVTRPMTKRHHPGAELCVCLVPGRALSGQGEERELAPGRTSAPACPLRCAGSPVARRGVTWRGCIQIAGCWQREVQAAWKLRPGK